MTNSDERVKRIPVGHEDERRAIFDILEGEFVHAGRIVHKKGSKGGEHYHKQTEQVNYIERGRLRYWTKDLTVRGSPVKEVILEAGDTMTDPPYEWHASEALEETVAYFFTKKSRKNDGYERDTFRVPRDQLDTYELDVNSKSK